MPTTPRTTSDTRADDAGTARPHSSYEEHIRLNPEIELLLYLPAWLHAPIAWRNKGFAESRKDFLDLVLHRLRQAPTLTLKHRERPGWTVCRPPEGVAPSLLRSTVSHVLRTSDWFASPFVSDFLSARLADRPVSGFTFVSAHARIVYFVHGLGVTCIRATFRMEADEHGTAPTDGMTDLRSAMRAVRREIKSETTDDPFTALNARVASLTRDLIHIRGDATVEMLDPATHPGGSPLWLEGFLLACRMRETDSASHALETPLGRLCEAAGEFCGEPLNTPSEATVEDDDKPIVWSGGHGAFAIFRGADAVTVDEGTDPITPSANQIRVSYLWALAAVYWAALFHISDRIHHESRNLIAGSGSEADENRFKQLTLAIARIQHEADPVSLCDRPLDFRVYRALWEVWMGRGLMKSIERISKSAESNISYVVQRRQEEIAHARKRIEGWIVWIGLVFTLVSTLAAVLAFFDIQRDAPPYLESPLVWLFSALIAMLIASAALFVPIAIGVLSLATLVAAVRAGIGVLRPRAEN